MQGWRIRNKETGDYYNQGRWTKNGKLYLEYRTMRQAYNYIVARRNWQGTGAENVEIIEVSITEVGVVNDTH